MIRKILMIHLIILSTVFIVLAYKYDLKWKYLNKEGLYIFQRNIMVDIYDYYGFPTEVPVYIIEYIVTPLGQLFVTAVAAAFTGVFMLILFLIFGSNPPW